MNKKEYSEIKYWYLVHMIFMK